MSAISWDTFERYRQKGLDARRAGQWDSARVYLLEAARAMVELSKQAQGDELRDGRREMANKLLELARDCDEAKRENRKGGATTRKPSSAAESSEGEDGKNASDWIVRERPSIRFDDVAGLADLRADWHPGSTSAQAAARTRRRSRRRFGIGGKCLPDGRQRQLGV